MIKRTKKYFQHLSTHELQNLAGLCAVVALVVAAILVLSGSAPLVVNGPVHLEEPKPWALELP